MIFPFKSTILKICRLSGKEAICIIKSDAVGDWGREKDRFPIKNVGNDEAAGNSRG